MDEPASGPNDHCHVHNIPLEPYQDRHPITQAPTDLRMACLRCEGEGALRGLPPMHNLDG